MTESDLLTSVIDLAHVFGWKVAHFRAARLMDKNGKERWVTAVQGDGRGFLDLVLTRGTRLIFAELKSDKGKLSPEQEQWVTWLKGAGQEVYVWHPKDWLDGTIEGVLR